MFFEEFLHVVLPYIIGVLEIIGVFVLTFGTLKSFVLLLKAKGDVSDKPCKLQLAESIALGLTYLMAGEVLKTVVSMDLNQLLSLAIIVALRVVFAVVIHWESKHLH